MSPVASASEFAGKTAFGEAAHADDIDALRARHYNLLAVLLGRAPSRDLLDTLSTAGRGDGLLGQQIGELGYEAARATQAAVEREFFDLFVGVGRGELLPYASYYQTGFLNERPLARVREDLAALGLVRDDGMSEPEDHLAILLDVMAGMAAGRFEAESGMQARFFARHIAPWACRFFADLEAARAARFYRAVGSLGRTFIEVEADAFEMNEGRRVEGTSFVS